MIYLDHTTQPQRVLVPVAGAVPGAGKVTLVLKSTVNLVSEEWGYEAPASSPGLYLGFSVTLPEGFPSGSCEYELLSDGKVLASGVAQVGVYPSVSYGQYEREVEYEQYDCNS